MYGRSSHTVPHVAPSLSLSSRVHVPVHTGGKRKAQATRDGRPGPPGADMTAPPVNPERMGRSNPSFRALPNPPMATSIRPMLQKS